MIPDWAEVALAKPAKFSDEEIAEARKTLFGFDLSAMEKQLDIMSSIPLTKPPLEVGDIFTVGDDPRPIYVTEEGLTIKPPKRKYKKRASKG